jgi:hypothetical protein
VLLLAASTASAQMKSTATGTGIWLWNPQLFIGVFNMTEYQLTATASELQCNSHLGAMCYPFEDSDGRFFQPDLGHAYIDPYRTIAWRADGSTSTDPTYVWGRIIFHLSGKDAKFDFNMNFYQENDDQGYNGYGTWVSLLPVTASTWRNYNGSSDFNQAWANGRWTTPVNDQQMHNIMTLISDELVVSLYSPDNWSIVLAIQQNYSADWGSDKNRWVGWELNWADNDAVSCPGPYQY